MTPQEFSDYNPWLNSAQLTLLHNTGDAAVLRSKSTGMIRFTYRQGCALQNDGYQRKLFEVVMRKRFDKNLEEA